MSWQLRSVPTARCGRLGLSLWARYVWWNYMHSSLERIEAAKAEWRHGRVKLPSGDTESFTPCAPDEGRQLWRMNS